MNIEISPPEYWLIHTTFDEGKMHCFFLEHAGKKGWRLPTNQEANHIVNRVESNANLSPDFRSPTDIEFMDELIEYWFTDTDNSLGFWTIDDGDNDEIDENVTYDVIPVRDKCR